MSTEPLTSASQRRILLINYEYPPVGGGAGTATCQMAREFARAGHQPFVLTAAWGDLPFAELSEGVTVRRIAALRRRVDRCSVPEMLAFMGAAMLAAPGFARQWKIDAAIAFFTLPCGPVGWLLARTNHIPYAIALRGGDVPGFDRATLGFHHALTGGLIRRLWRDADAVIANSDGLAQLARQHDPHREIGSIPVGVDAQRFSGKTYGPSGGTVEILFVGRIVEQKGLDVLVRALASLAAASWRLTLVGDGVLRAEIAALARRHGLAERVVFKGWVAREDLAAILRGADLFVLPSREEGMANAMMEAMASGLPVVATRIAGSSEVVVDGETGLLVPADDEGALGRALETLVADPTMRERMGRAGRARAEAHYTWRAAAARWLRVIEAMPRRTS